MPAADIIAVNLPGFVGERKIVEYCAGVAQNEIEYPGIAQCISITGLTTAGMIGAHISPGSTRKNMDDLLQMLRSGGIKTSIAIYVVGNFDEHFSTSNAIWKQKKQMIKELRSTLDTRTVIYSCNTSQFLQNVGGHSLNIWATRQPTSIQFTYRARTGENRVAPSQLIHRKNFEKHT